MKPSPAAARRLSSPVLVGREVELGLLLEAALHPPALVLVEGEGGIGKTRLVAELLARPELGRCQRLVGGCQQLSEPFPLGPLVEALREVWFAPAALGPVAGALRPLLPELADRLPEQPDPLGDRGAERHRLFRATRELLGALGSTVLVLEDLHWADETTIEMLRFMAPQLPPDLALVCTYRREDLPAGSPLLGLAGRLPREVRGVAVALEPLGRDEVGSLVAKILDADEVSDEFADEVLRDSGGLPFAVEEILRLLRERRDVVRQHGVWVRRELDEIGVPRALRDAILERVGRLSAEAQRVVEAAAVIGSPSPEEQLFPVAELKGAAAQRALVDALSSAVLLEVGDGRYGFRHALARQAVADSIPSPVLRRLHLRAAEAFEKTSPKPHARLAHHYRAAGETRKWIRHAEAAADRASSLEDDATAYRLLKDALAVEGLSRSTRARLAVKLASHARHCLAFDDAAAVLQRLLEDQAISRGTRGELRLSLAGLLISSGEVTEASSQAKRAADELSRRPALAAMAMVRVALPWGDEGRLDEQLHWLDRAAQTAASAGDRAVQISVAGQRAVVLLQMGDPRGWAAVDEIPAPADVGSELRAAVRARVNLVDSALQLGQFRRVDEFLGEGHRLLAQISDPEAVFAFRINELQRDLLIGSWADLEDRVRLALEACEDAGHFRADAEAVLGLLLLARGRVRDAARILERLGEDFKGEASVLAWVSAGLARIRLVEGRKEAALEETARALDIIETRRVWAWATDVAPVTVDALLRLARTREAEQLTDRFAEGLSGRDAPPASAALSVCRAQLADAAGRAAEGVRHYLAAERALQSLPRPYDAARAREGAGRCLLAHDHARGAQLLVEAADLFRELGATWDAARVRGTLKELGVIPPHRRGRKSYEGELSPRERQVAQLAAEGLSNREIAQTLFLSQKTVEGHLRSTMRKLGVASRGELPMRLETDGSGAGT